MKIEKKGENEERFDYLDSVVHWNVGLDVCLILGNRAV